MRELRTNTATRVTVGPFIDKTDGITPEVALTVTSEKLTLVVDDAGVPTLVLDAAPTASGGSNDMVHITNDDAGLYDLELAAANTNYLGRALLGLNDVATHVPVWHEFMILTAAEYDRKYSTGHTVEDIYTAVVTNAAGADIAADIIALKAETVEILADTTVIGSTGQGLTSLATQASVNTIDDFLDTEIAAIYGAVITNAAGTDIAADIIAVKADTAAILTDTGTTLDGRIPAALVGGKMDSSVGAVAAGAINNAGFNADVGSTAFATNILALAVFKALDSAITDAVSLTAGGLLEKVRKLTWILGNKIEVIDANGNTVVYKDDSSTAAYTVNAALTDDSTTTTRLRMA